MITLELKRFSAPTPGILRVEVTIRDVARRAGVSISTVSRVLNNTCTVSEDKKARVEEAAEFLGYVPNPSARSLLKKSTGGIGILLPYVSGEFFSEFLTGADRLAKEEGVFLLISAAHHRAAEWRASVRSVYGRVDGLIVMDPRMSPRQLDLKSGVPTVFVNAPIEGEDLDGLDVINFDNRGGTLAAARHLLQLGHRKFAYLRGPEDAFDAVERLDGFRDAMREAGISDYKVIDAGFEPEDGHAAGRELLAGGDLPTAVMCANDYCAQAVMAVFHDAGLLIPEQVSVVGFDNVPSSGYARPALTTLSVPPRKTGAQALERVIARIRDRELPATRLSILPVDLVIRASTAAPARIAAQVSQ